MRLGLVNISGSLFLKIFSKFLSVGLTLYLIKISSFHLNSEEISYWLTFVSITSFAYLFDFGISTKIALSFSESRNLQYSKSTVLPTQNLVIFIFTVFVFSILLERYWLSEQIEFSSSGQKYLFIFFTASIFLNIYFEKIFIGYRNSYYFYFFQIISFIFIFLLIKFFWKPIILLNYLYIYFFISFAPGLMSWSLLIKNKKSLFVIEKSVNNYLRSLKKSFAYWYIYLAYVFFIVLDFLLITNYYGANNLLTFNLYLRVFQLIIIPPLFLTNISWGQFANHSFHDNKNEINKLFTLILYCFLIYFSLSLIFLLIYFNEIIFYLGNLKQPVDNNLFFYFVLRAFCEIFLIYFINLVNSLKYNAIFLKRLFFFCVFLLLGKSALFFLNPSIETFSIFMIISIIFLLINFKFLYNKINNE